jgi:outer membrane receptor for ferrienterochelin and colicins
MLPFLLLLSAPIAHAAGIADEAEVNFQLGAKAYKAKDYQTALAYFMASNRLSPNKNVTFNIARCYARLGLYPEAYRWYADALEGVTDAGARATIQAEQEALLPNVAVFEVTSNPPGAAVYVNRKNLGSAGNTPLTLALPAGEYSFLVEAQGYADGASMLFVAETGSKQKVAVELQQQVGKVSFDAAAGATIHLGNPDAAPLCTAPCEANIPPGNWVMWARLPGFKDTVRQSEVVIGGSSRLSFAMEPLTGSLLVDIPESGALIEVDGKPMGFTPAVVPNMPVGEHTVRISRRGYRASEVQVVVEPDTQFTLSGLELVPVEEVAAVSKTAEDVRDAPSSVTIISGQELRAFGYPTIYEAMRGVRGTALTMDSVYSGVAVRGLGQPNDFGNRLLILSDGATLNDDILYQSFVGYDGRTDLGDVERIEVVRGPGSVLYGTGAVSGVINLVPTDDATPGGQELTAGVAPYNVGRLRLQTRGRSDDGGYHLSAGVAGSEGRTVDLPIGGGEVATIDSFDRFRAVSATARGWKGDLRGQAFYTARNQVIPTGAYATLLGDDRTVWLDQRFLAEGRFEPQLNETWALATRVYGNFYGFDGDYVYDDGEGGTYVSTETYRGVWLGGEARAVASVADPLRLTLGTQVEAHPSVSLAGFDTYSDGSTEDYLDEQTSFVVAAAYAVADGQPTGWFRYSVGARADYWSTVGLSVNPRVAVVLKPSDNDTIKVFGGRAFRAPSTYELLYNVPEVQETPASQGIELEPEQVWSGELEYTHQLSLLWSGLVSVHAAQADNIVETVDADPAVGSITYANSESPIRTLGFDTEARRSLRGGWMASASYGYLEAVYSETGEPIANAPQHFASGKLIAPIIIPFAQVAMRATLEAPRHLDGSERTTDPAVVADVVVSGESNTGGLSYRVGLYNLLDYSYAVPVTDEFAAPTMPQQGRSLLAELTVRR